MKLPDMKHKTEKLPPLKEVRVELKSHGNTQLVTEVTAVTYNLGDTFIRVDSMSGYRLFSTQDVLSIMVFNVLN